MGLADLLAPQSATIQGPIGKHQEKKSGSAVKLLMALNSEVLQQPDVVFKLIAKKEKWKRNKCCFNMPQQPKIPKERFRKINRQYSFNKVKKKKKNLHCKKIKDIKIQLLQFQKLAEAKLS